MSDQPAHSPQPSPPQQLPGTNTLLDQYMPIVLFLVLNSTVNLLWAIVAMTAWSVKTALFRWRRGLPQGRVAPILVAYLLVRGIVGIIVDSEEVYFGIGIVVKGLWVPVLLGSVFTSQSLAGRIAPYAFEAPAELRRHPVYRTAMNRVSVGVALALAGNVVFDFWLLLNSSIHGFVIFRYLFSWGLIAVSLTVMGWYLETRLRRIDGFPGLMVSLERRLEQMGFAPPAREPK